MSSCPKFVEVGHGKYSPQPTISQAFNTRVPKIGNMFRAAFQIMLDHICPERQHHELIKGGISWNVRNILLSWAHAPATVTQPQLIKASNEIPDFITKSLTTSLHYQIINHQSSLQNPYNHQSLLQDHYYQSSLPDD